jgi:hypothetical protein
MNACEQHMKAALDLNSVEQCLEVGLGVQLLSDLLRVLRNYDRPVVGHHRHIPNFDGRRMDWGQSIRFVLLEFDESLDRPEEANASQLTTYRLSLVSTGCPIRRFISSR